MPGASTTTVGIPVTTVAATTTTATTNTVPLSSAARPLTGRLLALLAGLAAIGTLSTNIILPSFASIAQSMGVPVRDLGWLLSSFFIAFALGQLFVGPLSDRWGRRNLVLGGLVLFTAGSLLCAWAPSMPVLLAGRVVQPLGVCAASVLSRAIARDLFDGEALARTLALTMVAMAAAPGFSPLLGSAMEQGPGWRASFVLVAVLGLLLAAAHAAGIGETHPADRRVASSLGAVLRGYATLARDARFILPASAVSLIIGGLYAYFAATPVVMMGRLGLDAFQLGLFFAATVLVVFAAGLLSPRLARRFGLVRVAMAGGVIALAGGLLLVLGGEQGGLLYFSLAVSVFLLGMGLLNPLGTAMALGPFAAQAGLASALLGGLQMGCAALMTALASALPMGPDTALALMLSGAAALACLALAGAGRRAP